MAWIVGWSDAYLVLPNKISDLLIHSTLFYWIRHQTNFSLWIHSLNWPPTVWFIDFFIQVITIYFITIYT